MAATKDQERKALAQIKQIVADLGEDSYIGMAFEGVWQLAEENIELDFGNSCAWYIKRCAEQDDLLREEIDNSNDKERRLSDHIKMLKCELGDSKECIKALEKRIVDLEKSLDREYAACEDLNNDKMALANLVELKNLEIIKLKAKLFDLMFSDN